MRSVKGHLVCTIFTGAQCNFREKKHVDMLSERREGNFSNKHWRDGRQGIGMILFFYSQLNYESCL